MRSTPIDQDGSLIKKSEKKSPSLKYVILLALVLVVAFQGSRGLFETTEGRYAESAREMLVSNNFLEPTLDFQPHWTKPPLTYWAIAAGLRVFGLNTWGARAFLIPAYLFTILAMYLLGEMLWGKGGGGWTALVYASSLMTGIAANVVSTDVLLTMWAALATSFFWKAMAENDGRSFLLFWAFTGGAFLTKGPPGILFLSGLLPALMVARKHGYSDIPRLFTFRGILIFTMIGLGWYIYEAAIHPELLSYWLGYETFGRLADTESFHNPQWYLAFKVYGPVLVAGAMPWLAIYAFRAHKLKKQTGSFLSRILRVPQWTYVFTATLLPLIIFSISTSKLPLYMLPLFIPISAGLGRGIQLMSQKGLIRLKTAWTAAVLTVLLVVSLKGASGYFITNSNDMKFLDRYISETEAQAGPEDLYVFGKAKLYGLEFYRNSLLQRIDPDTGELQGKTKAVNFSSHLKAASAAGRTQLILTREFRLDDIKSFLDVSGFEYSVNEISRKWYLLKIPPDI
ncbi:MAG: PMT family glycosyltransferase, 4-amino-4-deoxy-L-arabinose transferase [Synergistales bacterium 54_9]|nr:MAG: PMT family glycosyltransferase, 4-amino-4-deoxy-L-arabinose transferase [Synergistales bacterium 54_9]